VERVEHEPITGSGAEPPAGSKGRAPGGVRWLGAESFSSIFIQKETKSLVFK